MADLTRAADEFFTDTLAVVTITAGGTADTQEGWYTTVSDSGQTKSESFLNDLSGGSDIVPGTTGAGTLTLGNIISSDVLDPYAVLDAARIASTDCTVVVAITRGGATATWTYTGCQVMTVPGPTLDASGSSVAMADITISYADRTFVGS